MSQRFRKQRAHYSAVRFGARGCRKLHLPELTRGEQACEKRSGRPAIAINLHVIGAERVDGDDDDVLPIELLVARVGRSEPRFFVFQLRDRCQVAVVVHVDRRSEQGENRVAREQCAPRSAPGQLVKKNRVRSHHDADCECRRESAARRQQTPSAIGQHQGCQPGEDGV